MKNLMQFSLQSMIAILYSCIAHFYGIATAERVLLVYVHMKMRETSSDVDYSLIAH